MSHMTHAERPTIELEKSDANHTLESGKVLDELFLGVQLGATQRETKVCDGRDWSQSESGGHRDGGRQAGIFFFFLRMDSSSDLWGFGPVAVVERLSEMEPPAAVAEMSSEHSLSSGGQRFDH